MTDARPNSPTLTNASPDRAQVSPSAASEQQLYPLTSLRFFAALYVVLFHVAIPYLDERSLVTALLKHGWAAVYFFFVLSGFVLGTVYGAAPTSARRFWLLRLFRVYPMHLFALLLLIPLNLTDLQERYPDSAGGELVAISASVLLLLHGWSGSWWHALNYPSWSLSSEAYFYALFPALNRVLRRVSRSQHLLLVGGACVAIYAALAVIPAASGSACPTHAECHTWLQWVMVKPVGNTGFFVVGIVMGRIFAADRRRGIVRHGTAYFLGTLGALAGVFWSGLWRWDGLVMRAAFMPLFAVLVFGAAHARGPLARALSARPLVYLGDISYSFYILQVPVLWVVTKVLHEPMWEPTSHLALGVFLVALLLASMGTYALIETPMRTLGRRLFNQPRAPRA